METLESLKKVAEYIGTVQPIVDAYPALKEKAEKLEKENLDLKKLAGARPSVEALVDTLVSTGIVSQDRKPVLLEKLASDSAAMKELVAGLLKHRGVAASVGQGVETKSASAQSGDEFDRWLAGA